MSSFTRWEPGRLVLTRGEVAEIGVGVRKRLQPTNESHIRNWYESTQRLSVRATDRVLKRLINGF